MPVSIFGSTINGGSARGAGRLVFKTTAVVEALNMNGKAIKNLPFPNVETDAVNKQYVDDKIIIWMTS